MAMTYGAGQAVGNLQAVGAQVVAPTIAGAIGKLDTINTRLAEAVNALEAISDQIGGPRAASTDSGPSSMPPTGAVNRMHNATDRANEKLAEIESLIGSISRMLG